MDSRQSLRQKLRDRRRTLSPKSQALAANRMLQLAIQHDLFSDCSSLALYCALDGEVNPLPLAQHAWQLNIPVYLPVVDPIQLGKMTFRRWTENSPLTANQFGIPEPRSGDIITPEQLHTVLLPLVGFDIKGNRLGMGGGYYDRTFSFRKSQHKPFMIGLAHECQKVAALSCAPWDMPLDAVLTDVQWYE